MSTIMGPEEAALVRRELLRRFDKATLAPVVAHARTHSAKQVVLGVMPSAWVAAGPCLWRLGIATPEQQTHRFFEMVISRAASEIEREMDEAAEEIVYQIGHLVDRGVSTAEIARVAAAHAGPLVPAQVRDIVSREQAWWVRCHAQLEEMPRAA